MPQPAAEDPAPPESTGAAIKSGRYRFPGWMGPLLGAFAPAIIWAVELYLYGEASSAHDWSLSGVLTMSALGVAGGFLLWGGDALARRRQQR